MADSEKETAYRELSAAFRQLDDFRAKLLGLLPLASGAGIYILLDGNSSEVPAALAILAAFVTFGLGIHEIRTIFRCKALLKAGRQLEQALNIDPLTGLFQTYPRQLPYPIISTGVASAVVYGSVLIAWVYTACRLAST